MLLLDGQVELKNSKHTVDHGALQKSADFVSAFMMGFDVQDAVALLRMDDLYVDSFEISDVKDLKGDHMSRAIGRIAGQVREAVWATERGDRGSERASEERDGVRWTARRLAAPTCDCCRPHTRISDARATRACCRAWLAWTCTWALMWMLTCRRTPTPPAGREDEVRHRERDAHTHLARKPEDPHPRRLLKHQGGSGRHLLAHPRCAAGQGLQPDAQCRFADARAILTPT